VGNSFRGKQDFFQQPADISFSRERGTDFVEPLKTAQKIIYCIHCDSPLINANITHLIDIDSAGKHLVDAIHPESKRAFFQYSSNKVRYAHMLLPKLLDLAEPSINSRRPTRPLSFRFFIFRSDCRPWRLQIAARR
jgi:hypothetical protein